MTDPRDLIQRLTDVLDGWQLCCVVEDSLEEDSPDYDLIREARAYLAQPKPEKPTDDGLLFTFYEASLSEGGDSDEVTLRGLRAVLARYCNQHPTRETHLQP